MYSYCPFLSTIGRVCDSPDLSFLVPFPRHVFAFRLVTGLVQILKSCVSAPLFVTLKLTAPTGISDDFESVNFNSPGLPMVTVTVAIFAAEEFCDWPAAPPAAPSNHAVTTAADA